MLLLSTSKLQAAEIVNVESSGYYDVTVHFAFLSTTGNTATANLFVGENLAANFTLPKRIIYSNFPFLQDEFGNDRMPHRTQLLQADSTKITLFLDVGEVSVETASPVEILSVDITPHIPLASHAEYLANLADLSELTNFTNPQNQQNQLITIEAEEITQKSSMSIVPSAMTGAGITPQQAGLRRLNVIGLNSFNMAGDFAEWSFDVPQTGLYYLTFAYLQNVNINLSSFRTISINGTVPFAEFSAVAFPFSTRWQNLTLDYPVFLAAGQNTIRLTVTNQPYSEILANLTNTITQIRRLDSDLRAITGNEVDPFRLWDLTSYIPNLAEILESTAADLDNIISNLSYLTGFSDYRALAQSTADLRRFAARPNDLANSTESLSRVVASLTDWLIALETQPLILDKFHVHTENAAVPAAIPGFFARFLHAIRNFAASFGAAAAISATDNFDGIQVWVRRSRDYVDLMQQMSNEIFTPQTNIPVRVNFIPDNTVLMLANAAGTLPELAAGMDNPFEYAIRGALVDLTQFANFAEISAPMSQGALIPYRIRNGVYALPEEVIFNVMFYRTDILTEAAPSTWDDVLGIIPVLSRQNATFFFPYGDFQTFFAQNNVPIYTPDGLSLAANTEEGFAAFRFWTDLYLKYGLPPRMESFYQHFRMGTAPIGVAPITEYIRFDLTAPDIAGQWNIAAIPGTPAADGTINRSQAGSQTGIMMFDTANNNSAWQFMQWWLTTETQVAFAQNLQNFYGAEFRWYTANFDVLAQLDWRPQTAEVFRQQLAWYNPVPPVAGGSYMTGREIWNAWTRTVIQRQNYREQLENAFRDISQEMRRKQLEFNLIDQNNNILQTLDITPFQVP
ncbi:MAG: extracellular solute-binding protein [Firmicutes bacterium]|nr:extracellular solute-binding protein [Bacillota bacterium]